MLRSRATLAQKVPSLQLARLESAATFGLPMDWLTPLGGGAPGFTGSGLTQVRERLLGSTQRLLSF